MISIAAIVCLCTATAAAPTLDPQGFEGAVKEAGGRVEFVFEQPQPFEQCHASTLVETVEGDLLCAWFAGTREKAPDVGIWMSRFSKNTWSEPERVVKLREEPHWNPVLFRDAEDAIHLFFKAGPSPADWQTYWMSSEDGGRTWGEAEELVAGDVGGRGPVRSKPIILSDGSWLAGGSTEMGPWRAFADRSTDRGKTWTRSEDFQIDETLLPGKGAIQPTLWESEPGVVHAYLRSQGGRIWETRSEDYGQTWSKVRATDLPNNNSGVDALGLGDGRVLLVMNPVPLNWGPRTPLTLLISWDNGDNWHTIARLEDDPDIKQEYSYPALVGTEDGVAISYTWRRQQVKCWQVPFAALKPWRAPPEDE